MPLDLPTSGIRSFHYQRSDTHKHQGIDLGGREGTPVYSTAPGVVRHATTEWMQGFGGYGRVVTVDHDDGTHALYAHLLEPDVSAGDRVEAGQQIGKVGRTKYSNSDRTNLFNTSGAHLHFEISPKRYPLAKEAERIDPIEYMHRGNFHPIALVRLGKILEPPKRAPKPPIADLPQPQRDPVSQTPPAPQLPPAPPYPEPRWQMPTYHASESTPPGVAVAILLIPLVLLVVLDGGKKWR